ncbi:MAG: OmpA family protein [Candidatus Tectomicrobia bacterium]|uniref:OmpA family protein n=1 Tax=Tectimicrobiota bacterium TaxID=2528274 RepID=A0A932CNX4_UNCTE|nr:OmpA family protein [Candidatus Tectomicrobia bacterium]
MADDRMQGGEKLELRPRVKIFGVVVLLGVIAATLYLNWGRIGRLLGPKESGTMAARSGEPSVPAQPAKSDPIRVRVNIWVGCAPGLIANGNLTTQKGSIMDRYGLNVEFKIIDNWTDAAAAFASGKVDMMLYTVDVYAKDFYQYTKRDFGSKAFLMVDWSRGADGIVAKPGINTIEDLAGKIVAYPPYTPSHTLLLDALKHSSLSPSQVDWITKHAVVTNDGIESALAFAQERVDAAVAWDPDMTDAMNKRRGSKKILDTRTADRLIADILVVSDDFSRKHPTELTNFAHAWIEGVEYIKKNPSSAYQLIGSVKEFNIPTDLAQAMLQGVVLGDYPENLIFFGLGPNKVNDFGNIFELAQANWKGQAVIGGLNDYRKAQDTRSLEALRSFYPGPVQVVETPYAPPKPGQPPLMTQQKTIYFATNSDEINPASRVVIDEIGKMMQAYHNTVVDIVGNTDGKGLREYNVALSKRRADAVKGYLKQRYDFPADRMRTFGNGPDQPVASNDTEDGRALNRRTDIKVYPNPAAQ